MKLRLYPQLYPKKKHLTYYVDILNNTVFILISLHKFKSGMITLITIFLFGPLYLRLSGLCNRIVYLIPIVSTFIRDLSGCRYFADTILVLTIRIWLCSRKNY